MEETNPPSWVNSDSEERERAHSPGAIRASLAASPRPTVPTEYNVEESPFWRTRHVPPGSVISFASPSETGPRAEGEVVPIAAVLVLETESLPDGVWLTVRAVGGSTESEKKRVQSFFKGSKKRVHICYYPGGECVDKEDALHLHKFTWYPPGDFEQPWLTTHGKKLVADGKKIALEASKGERGGEKKKETAGRETPGSSEVERRLSALRRRAGPRVSFALDNREPEERTRGASPGPLGAGVHRRPSGSDSRAVALLPRVKEEVEMVNDSTSEGEKKRKRKTRRQDLGQTLIKAAKVREVVQQRPEKKKRKSRSRSRSRRRRRNKKRRSSDSESGSDSGRESSSGESSLVAPLKRRSQRTPGSVYKMLEDQAVERLAADGLVEEGYEAQGLRGQRPKMSTYFQVLLKPRLDPRGRDCKELAMLARSLDLLRDGRLAELADVLAARLIAVDTATHQGWATARHLEVYVDDEENTAPAHVLLAAQRHARQVEKAGGPRQSGWYGGDWGSENRPKGKGKENKGKGKKGKPKGKGAKGWNTWSTEGQPKPDDKAKKGDAAT